MRLAALSFLGLAMLAACADSGPPGSRGTYEAMAGASTAARVRFPAPRAFPVTEASGSGAERAFVSGHLSRLQRRSFAENREYCGYMGLDAAGQWVATPDNPGLEAACILPPVPAGMIVVASFHTHSTFSPHYASEWPTTQDVATDRESNIDGYISTPGGRLWHVDTDTMTVHELCGRGCLPQDPRYIASQDGPLRPVLTYRQLQAWERSIGG